jgi:transglutaminase-like putative cysteine protease
MRCLTGRRVDRHTAAWQYAAYMNRIRALACSVAWLLAACGLAEADLLQQVGQSELQGQFWRAAALSDKALADTTLPHGQRKQLEFERDRLDRIRRDFPLTKDTLFTALNKSVKGLGSEEFERWLAEGRFDSREFDGERRFMVSSVSNLFWRHPELNPRRIPPKGTAKQDKAVYDTCKAIQEAARAEEKPYVLPKRFRVTMTVTAKANAAPDGEIVRAWLPIPRHYPFQKDFELLKTSSPVKGLAPESSSIRSVHLEQRAKRNKPTEFRVEYDYTAYGVCFAPRADQVYPFDPHDAVVRQFTREAPHIVFTRGMRALSQQITGEETNPLRQAKRFYDWIAENIKYSYAIEYSTIRNISEYCRSRGYGDCGQEALLFMTLCRLNGIPARWQSGWNTFPGGESIHDWCEVYVPPRGWMPVDPWAGINAMQYAATLTPEQRHTVRDFYFGGLDQYRMAANSDHCQELTPAKRSLRSDTVDFQRGELEWGDHNIYFDQYSFKLDLKEAR